MSRDQMTTKEKIQNAALKLFSQKGFNGATTSEIAREAGVAEGTIFRYFPTKKDLLLGVVNPVIVDTLRDVIEKTKHSSPEEVLEAILYNRLELVSQNIELVKIIVSEIQFHPEIKEKFLTQIILPAIDLIQDYFKDQQQKGILRDIDTEISVRVLLGMAAVFVIWKYAIGGEKYVKFSDEAVVSTIIDIFLNGMLKKTEEVAAE